MIWQDATSIYVNDELIGKHSEKYEISSLRLENSVLLNLKYNGKKLSRLDQFMIGDSPTFYTNFYDKKLKNSLFFLHEVNPSNLQISAGKKISERTVEARKKISF